MKIELSKLKTDAPAKFKKDKTEKDTFELCERLGHLQHRLYAEGKRSVLIVLQGLDASGKDGTIRSTFRFCSPTGVAAYGFKKPTEEEANHDFLWRVHKLAPEKGKIQVFNRSHYEDVLIQRVRKWITEEHAMWRIGMINCFEELLQKDNGTLILKFFLHISRDRQMEKLNQRLEDASKNWKYNPGDYDEAKLYDEYMAAYQDVLNMSQVPWFIVPSDQRWYRNYFVVKTIVEELEKLDIKLPVLEHNP